MKTPARRIVAYSPEYAQLGLNPAQILLLCQILYWHNINEKKPFYKTMFHWQKELQISQDTIRRARKKLISLKILRISHQQQGRYPTQTYYHLNTTQLNKLLPNQPKPKPPIQLDQLILPSCLKRNPKSTAKKLTYLKLVPPQLLLDAITSYENQEKAKGTIINDPQSLLHSFISRANQNKVNYQGASYIAQQRKQALKKPKKPKKPTTNPPQVQPQNRSPVADILEELKKGYRQ